MGHSHEQAFTAFVAARDNVVALTTDLNDFIVPYWILSARKRTSLSTALRWYWKFGELLDQVITLLDFELNLKPTPLCFGDILQFQWTDAQFVLLQRGTSSLSQKSSNCLSEFHWIALRYYLSLVNRLESASNCSTFFKNVAFDLYYRQYSKMKHSTCWLADPFKPFERYLNL